MDKQIICPVCGKKKGDSRYPLCYNCNSKAKKGELVGIQRKNYRWKVHTREGWQFAKEGCKFEQDPVFTKREKLITGNEKRFRSVLHDALKNVYGENFELYPQVALFSVVQKDPAAAVLINREGQEIPNRSELFRAVDFLVTDSAFCPLLVVEINDRSHNEKARIARDNDLRTICEEAGLPVIFLDGRSDAPEISSDELCRKIEHAQQDIAKTKHSTFLYKIQEPETSPQLPQESQPESKIVLEPSHDTEKAPKKGSNNLKGIVAIIALAAIIFGSFYLLLRIFF